MLHLLDDNGDSWVIERSTKKFRVFKNRQLIENDLKKTSLGTILDLDLKTHLPQKISSVIGM